MRWNLIDIGATTLLTLVAIGFMGLLGCGHKECDSCHSSAPGKKGTAVHEGTKQETEEAEIRANRAKLSPEDLRLVDAQEFCPVMEDSRLGSMAVPIKVMVKDKEGKEHPVFVCCKGCIRKAERGAQDTLAKVEQLKAKAASTRK